MNAIDLLLIAAIALSIVHGVRAGFVATTYALVTWVASLVIALAAHGEVAAALIGVTGIPAPPARAIAVIAVLIALQALFTFVGRAIVVPVVRRVRRVPIGAAADRVLGVVPAVARTLVIAAIGLAALLLLPVGNDVRSAVDGSRIARALVAEVAAVQPFLGALVGERDGAPLFVTKLSADDRQELDLPEGLQPRPDPDAEVQLVALVNEERVARGLRPLTVDERLVPVARAHSSEMFRLRYFAHVSEVTGTPFDRLDAAGIRYLRAGENLAYAHSVAVAHRGLMESPGHRANILRPEFTSIGIGVMSAGPYGRMFTQLYLTPR